MNPRNNSIKGLFKLRHQFEQKSTPGVHALSSDLLGHLISDIHHQKFPAPCDKKLRPKINVRR